MRPSKPILCINGSVCAVGLSVAKIDQRSFKKQLYSRCSAQDVIERILDTALHIFHSQHIFIVEPSEIDEDNILLEIGARHIASCRDVNIGRPLSEIVQLLPSEMVLHILDFIGMDACDAQKGDLIGRFRRDDDGYEQRKFRLLYRTLLLSGGIKVGSTVWNMMQYAQNIQVSRFGAHDFPPCFMQFAALASAKNLPFLRSIAVNDGYVTLRRSHRDQIWKWLERSSFVNGKVKTLSILDHQAAQDCIPSCSLLELLPGLISLNGWPCFRQEDLPVMRNHSSLLELKIKLNLSKCSFESFASCCVGLHSLCLCVSGLYHGEMSCLAQSCPNLRHLRIENSERMGEYWPSLCSLPPKLRSLQLAFVALQCLDGLEKLSPTLERVSLEFDRRQYHQPLLEPLLQLECITSLELLGVIFTDDVRYVVHQLASRLYSLRLSAASSVASSDGYSPASPGIDAKLTDQDLCSWFGADSSIRKLFLAEFDGAVTARSLLKALEQGRLRFLHIESTGIRVHPRIMQSILDLDLLEEYN